MTRILVFVLALNLWTHLGAQVAMPTVLGDAVSQATAEKKLIVLDFFSYNSVESKMVKDQAFGYPEVKKLLEENYVVLHVELERDQALRERYGVKKAPTVIVLRSDGSEFDRVAIFLTGQEFVEFLKAPLSGRTDIAVLVEKAKAPTATTNAYVTLAGTQYRRGKFVEATESYTQALDRILANLKAERRYLKLVLNRLGTLVAHTASAKEALSSRRDRLEAEVRQAPSEFIPVLFDLNEALNEPARSVSFFQALPKSSPWRREGFASVFGPLIEARDYATATSVVDLESFVGSLYPRDIPSDTDSSADSGPRAVIESMRKQRIVECTALAIEALLATGQPAKVRRLTERALEFDDTPAARARFMLAAQRAASTESTDFEKWLEHLPVFPPKSKPALDSTKTSIQAKG
jgi:hypothetical protein